MEKPDVIRNTLAQATGSEKVMRLFKGSDELLITDGVRLMADMCECYWLLIAIASWSFGPKTLGESFTDWTLKMDGKKALLIGEDGNGHELARQEIPYTDFPLPEGIVLFKVGNVLMLPSEY